MGWDATLCEGHRSNPGPGRLGEWNYTSNCNAMITAALAAAPAAPDTTEGRPWWHLLAGADGPAGAGLLHVIARELERDPVFYDTLNPVNGWGDRPSLVVVLASMRDAVPERPCHWQVGG